MRKILVVDDEIDILETIVESLEVEFEDSSVNIFFSSLPTEALKIFSDEMNFDLVITDLKMPNLNGFQLIKKLRLIDKNIPVIVFTAHGDRFEEQELLNIGVDTMLKKPNIESLLVHTHTKLKL
jgi:CheY-like chemotaxis protein